MRAVLHWVPSIEGGRTELPTGNRYVTIGRIENSNFPSRAECDSDWSMVIASFPSPREQGIDTLCDVSSLAPNAPHHELVSGVAFRLLEGAKTVAFGTIS